MKQYAPRCIYIVVFTLIMTSASQSAPVINSSQTGADASNVHKGLKAGYLEFLPLSPNYPQNLLPHERDFMNQIFSDTPKKDLHKSQLTFVPKDYKNIFETSFQHTLESSGLILKKYNSVAALKGDNCQILIWGVPLEFKVEDETKAVISILYRIYKIPGNEIVWEGTIDSEVVNGIAPKSISKKTLVFMLSSHNFNFQPQRAMLAYGVHKNSLQLLTELNQLRDDGKI